MTTIYRTATARCKFEFYDSDGALANPATSQTCTIIDPNEVKVVTAQAMTNTGSATGKWHYDYTSAATAMEGEYKAIGVGTDTGSVVSIGVVTFTLEVIKGY